MKVNELVLTKSRIGQQADLEIDYILLVANEGSTTVNGGDFVTT